MDILDYMQPDPEWDYHLEGDAHPIYTAVQGNQIWYCKSAKGFPWDMNTYNDEYVFQSITEGPNGWTRPDSFKIFASKSWPGSNGGIVWAPRKLTAPAPGVVTLDSSYRLYEDCKTYTEHDLGAAILTKAEGPYEKDFGGNIGLQKAIVTSYFWGPNYANLELNWWIFRRGWAQWELWNNENGVYVRKQVSAFNRMEPGRAVQVQFPCGVPEINNPSAGRR